jgi:hypothetical protein
VGYISEAFERVLLKAMCLGTSFRKKLITTYLQFETRIWNAVVIICAVKFSKIFRYYIHLTLRNHLLEPNPLQEISTPA